MKKTMSIETLLHMGFPAVQKESADDTVHTIVENGGIIRKLTPHEAADFAEKEKSILDFWDKLLPRVPNNEKYKTLIVGGAENSTFAEKKPYLCPKSSKENENSTDNAQDRCAKCAGRCKTEKGGD